MVTEKIKAQIEIIEFTDPACTWCWGSEPVLRKLQSRFNEQLKVSFIMGGLVEDAHKFMDPRNGIGGDLNKFNEQVGIHWLEASERHGMPVKTKGFKLFDDENDSTFPMNVAYKAAQFQDEEKADKFLRRMREAIASEAKQANKVDVLIELAQESGINIPQFIDDMENGKAKEAFEKDRYTTKAYQVNGFPSFLVKNSDGKEIILRGYQSYDNFKSTINYLSATPLEEIKKDATKKSVQEFVERFERVSTAEIKEAFDLSTDKAEEILKSLAKENVLTEISAGNGYFYKIASVGLMCDDSGLCSL